MKIFNSFEEAKNIINPVVTTGSFDGVHIGHKTILNRLRMLAGKYNGESVLITFDPHPRKVLYPKVVVVGFNHHFGFNKEGDYKQLWEWQEKYEFEAEEIPEQEVYHETVSSTKIRQAISEGYIQRANAYLDHYYIIKGRPENYSNEEIHGLP